MAGWRAHLAIDLRTSAPDYLLRQSPFACMVRALACMVRLPTLIITKEDDDADRNSEVV
jgi:hypothetical protein